MNSAALQACWSTEPRKSTWRVEAPPFSKAHDVRFRSFPDIHHGGLHTSHSCESVRLDWSGAARSPVWFQVVRWIRSFPEPRCRRSTCRSEKGVVASEVLTSKSRAVPANQ